MSVNIRLKRGTKTRIESEKSELKPYEIVYATDTKEIGVKKANGDIEYFKNTMDIDAIMTSKQDKLVAGTNITIDENNVISASGTGGGGSSDGDVTQATIDIPFTEVMSETQTTIIVAYSYVGDDPANFTADFSNFTLGGGLILDMGMGPMPISMAVQAVFGKTTLNYFEIIVLFRYLLSATGGGIIHTNTGETMYQTMNIYTDDYSKFFSNVFTGIDGGTSDELAFTVDFMMMCGDIPFYNTVTGRGSNWGVTVETSGDIVTAANYIDDYSFTSLWENWIKPDDDSGNTTRFDYFQLIGGMTLKLITIDYTDLTIKMKPNYKGAIFFESN